MSPIKLSRRSFVVSAATAAFAAPFLRVERAVAAAPPTRLIIFHTPNGGVPARWGATGGERDFTFQPGSILEPLAGHRDDLVLLEGFDMESSAHGPQNEPHSQGMGHMLTGQHLRAGTINDGSSTSRSTGFPEGPSVDQFIASRVGGDSPFRSIQLGVKNTHGNPLKNSIAFSLSGEPVAAENDPWAAFDRIFRDLPREDPTALDAQERSRFLRSRTLDHVRRELDSAARRLGTDDRRRIEEHIGHISALQSQMSGAPPAAGTACEAPMLGGRIDPRAAANFPAVMENQIDLAVAALACQRTRVVSVHCSYSNTYLEYPWLGVHIGHHSLSHNCNLRPADTCTPSMAEEQLVRVNRWYAENFARLLTGLQNVREGDGTLLDNTVVLWCTEHASGSHSRSNMRWVLGGSAGGRIQTGRRLRLEGAPHNNILLSLCHAMGVDVSTFGNPAYCTGPIGGLVS